MEFLLEVALEDLPAESISDLSEQLSAKFGRALEENRIPAEKLAAFSTIRRLVVHAAGLPKKQPVRVVEVSGPPAAVAFKPDGEPTPAGLGYCRAHGITPAELKIKDDGRKRVTYLLRKEKGETTRAILTGLVPRVLAGLSFNLPMRWAAGDASFIRPVTSILALLDGRVLPIEFAGVKAKAFTVGHPTLSPERVKVSSAAGYFKTMAGRHIVLDGQERVKRLKRRVDSLLPDGASYSADGLRRVALTLEYPEAALSELDMADLPFPEEAAAVIVEKLKCLPLYGSDKKLLPQFVIITDGKITREIAEGYRWVLGSRLEDGRFFWQEDIEVPVPERLEKLEKVIFQAKVGSLADYGRALEKTAVIMAERLGLKPEEADALATAARLAKADATTSMVREFPEVAGIMAASLLTRAAYPPPVAAAVKEHLLPRYSGDRIPEGRLGRSLSFLDKAVHLCGLFGAGIEPSGSSDPFGLRRLAYGCLEIAWQADFRLSLGETVDCCLAAWGKENGAREKIVAFLMQRLENGLQQKGFRPDVVAASLAAAGDSLTAYPARAACLTALLERPDGPQQSTTFSRVTNILRQAREKGISFGWFQMALLTEEAEKELFSFWISRAEEIEGLLNREDFGAAVTGLSELNPYINRFFDKVMVMDPDQSLRNNRLGLLEQVACALRRIGDLSKIQF